MFANRRNYAIIPVNTMHWLTSNISEIAHIAHTVSNFTSAILTYIT